MIARPMIKGALDYCFHLEIDKRESLRRALGRRIDPISK